MNRLAHDLAALRAINKRFTHNFVTSDVRSHDALMHPQFRTITPGGGHFERGPHLEFRAHGFDPAVPVYRDMRDERIEVLGDAALVTATTRLTVVPTTLWCASDPLLLERIVSNFVTNALRYTAAGGVLVGLASIPIGSNDITDDISSAFGTRRAQAERMKCFHGSATASPRDNHDMIDISPIGGDEEGGDPVRITRAQLIAVIRQRLEHWFGQVANALESLGFSGPVGRQVVLTGGGSELKGIADYAQGVLGRSVRIGRPRGLIGLPDAHSGPAFATLAGLVQFAASRPIDLRWIQHDKQTVVKNVGAGNILTRLAAALRGNF